ncbi:MAG: hypothetical protein ACRDGA_03125, partial [Bacteroidota bacterium]
EQTISTLAVGEEQPAMFSFSVDKSAPVGQEQTITFGISTSKGKTWMKQITVAVGASEIQQTRIIQRTSDTRHQ